MRNRLPQLDVLRGVAAFVVVLHHAILCLPPTDPIAAFVRDSPGLGMLLLGRPAVVLFFVLSGFVLALSLAREQSGFAVYALRRAFRLLPPFWAAVATSFAMYTVAPRHLAPSMSLWFNEHWGRGISPHDLGRNLLMLSSDAGYPGDHVVWSLVHEFRLSMLIPLMLWGMLRFGPRAVLACALAITAAASFYIDWRPTDFVPQYHGFYFDSPTLPASLVLSARFTFAFAFGAALAMWFDKIAPSQDEGTDALAMILAAAGFVGLCTPHELGMTLGAGALVLATALTDARWLIAKPLAWIGRVSFSLYLNHLPTMLMVGLMLEGVVAPRVALALAILVSLVLAEVMYLTVETPSLRLGRVVAARLRRGPRAPLRSREQPAG